MAIGPPLCPVTIGQERENRVAPTAATLFGCGNLDRGWFGWGHVDHATATLGAELDLALHQSEQRVVATATDAITGVEVGTALPNENLARVNELATEPLHAETLSVGVATVPARRRTFLVCHDCLSPRSR